MGVDVLGSLPEALRKVRFVIVAVNYFTKWIEAKPLAKTTGKEVKKFIWDNIICRYGLPKIIVTDNVTNFIHDTFKSWCKKLNITQINTAVAQPQANGLVERENMSLIEGIKTRLGRERKEIGMPTHWKMMIKEVNGNKEEMRLNLDLLTERKEATAIQEARKARSKMGRTILDSGSISEWLIQATYNRRQRGRSPRWGKAIFLLHKCKRR
nr:hypothetical protein [Tanacetum cinerariifolium]